MSSTNPSSSQPPSSLTLESKDFPALYRATDEAAKTYQRGFIISILVEIGLTLLGALALVLEQNPSFVQAVGPVASVQVPGGKVFPLSLATAAALLGTAVTLLYQYALKPGDKWRQSRFLAERCATLAWRYAAHAAPFDLGRAGTATVDVDRWYLDQNTALLKEAAPLDLVNVAHGHDDVLTPAMIALRGASLAERFRIYSRDRAIAQRNWYKSRSQMFRQRRNTLRAVTVTIYIIGAGLVILHATPLRTLAPFGLLLPNYWPLVVAAAGAVTGYVAARHYDDLQRIYGYTAVLVTGELNAMENSTPTDDDEAKIGNWVDRIETILDTEHRQWRALITNDRNDPVRQNLR
jgi:energy-converting hydrogenase Eha subunit C